MKKIFLGGLPRKLLNSLTILVIIVLVNVTGYAIIEKVSFWDALYMTVITMSTVGFSEVIPLDHNGRIFTIVVILSGFTFAAYALSTITSFLVSGEIINTLRGNAMERQILRLKDHYIVCGFGKLGSEIAHGLSQQRSVFCVIDRDEDHVANARKHGYLVIQGDAVDDDTLINAGIHRAKGLVAALTGDPANVMLVVTARNLNPKLKIVARGSDDSSEAKLLRAGADRVELPFAVGGRRMAMLVDQPSLVEFMDLVAATKDFQLRIEDIEVTENSKLVDKSLSESNIRKVTHGALIMAIKREDQLILHPSSDKVFKAGDRLLILCDSKQLNALLKEYNL